MFVQSLDFETRHKGGTLRVYGQERVEETVRLCKMNLAVHGLGGSVLQGNSYYSDPFEAVGKFNYVMANPPFNVDGVNKEDLAKRTDRFPYGMPKNDNGNYLWIQMFLSSLASNGRAGFVMANSASDARQSEMEIRRQMIQAGVVDVMVAVGSNMLYTVTLPVTLWFLDKGKQKTERRDQILFIDAVVGRSNIVGKPIANMLVQKGRGADATVTVVHTKTKNLAEHCKRADILIVAAGVPGLVKPEWIKPGAYVIDVGVNRVGEKPSKDDPKKMVPILKGDVDFEAAREIAGYITPVPGGVGPTTITMLMKNTLKSLKCKLGVQ